MKTKCFQKCSSKQLSLLLSHETSLKQFVLLFAPVIWDLISLSFSFCYLILPCSVLNRHSANSGRMYICSYHHLIFNEKILSVSQSLFAPFSLSLSHSLSFFRSLSLPFSLFLSLPLNASLLFAHYILSF